MHDRPFSRFFFEFCVERLTFEDCPDFLIEWAIDNIPREEWPDSLVNFMEPVPADFKDLDFSARQLVDIARGRPVLLTKLGKRAQDKKRTATAHRLLNEPDFDAERRRLKLLCEELFRTPGDPKAVVDAAAQRIMQEATIFAERVHFQGVSVRDVALALWQSAFGNEVEPEYVAKNLVGSDPLIYVNPNPHPIAFTMPPSSIVVDATNVTKAGLLRIWSTIEKEQKRLHQPRVMPGRPRFEAVYVRGIDLHDPSRGMTWERVWEQIEREFKPSDRPSSYSSFMRGMRRYKNDLRNESRTAKTPNR